MDNNFDGWGIDKQQYNEFEKLQMKRAISGVKFGYTRISDSLTLIQLLDVPEELFKSIEFITEYKLGVTFYESAEFCVEKYFKTNFDLLKGEKLTIKYLNKEGYAVRTDEYEISKMVDIMKEPLTRENKDLTVKIILECSGHDISTCKE
jgi:hypothetical protein